MRGMWNGLGFVLATLLTIAGCKTEDHLKPPKQPECYVLPPQSDARFSQPPEYPRKYLMQDAPLKGIDPTAPDPLSPTNARRGGGLGAGAGGAG